MSCETLFEHLGHDDWVVFDCRHALDDAEAGPRAHAASHIPGAFHAHIDRDLSREVGDGMDGRHPLPEPDAVRQWAGRHGITPETQVVAYDDVGGAWAGRVWWLLRHYGHEHVAVLDGGLTRWQELGLPMQQQDPPARDPVDFDGSPGHMPTVDGPRIEAELDQESEAYQVLDAREAGRYRGDTEPIDPVAGHIPGALNAPFKDNLDKDQRFLSPDELRTRYEDILGVQEVGRVVVYCGSGVTAAHDILAMEVAGMGTAALYPGSWSEWCQPDAERPLAPEKAQRQAEAARAT